MKDGTIERLRAHWKQSTEWIRQHVPPGLRTLLGLLFMIGGVFGILPILGFWMIPFGVVIVAMDFGSLRAAWGRWRERRSAGGADGKSTQRR